MPQVKYDVPLTDGFITASSTYPRWTWVNDSALNPLGSTWFEVIGKVASGTLTVTLVQFGTTTVIGTLTFTETTYTRKRVQVTLSSAGYFINMSGGTSPSIAARGITYESSNTILKRVSPIRYLGSATGLANTTIAPLVNAQYWKYIAANYSNFTQCIVQVYGRISSNMQTYTVYLQEDNGNFANWTNVVTIANAKTNTAYELAQVTGFSPTNGRNYRIASLANSNMITYDIPFCSIFVQSDNATTGITEIELANHILSGPDSGTGLQSRQTQYLTSDWDFGSSGSLVITHQIDSDNASNSAKLTVPPSTDITSSTVTGANQQTSSSLTLTNNTEIDTNVINSTGTISASKLNIIWTYSNVVATAPRNYAIIIQ